MKFVQKLIVPNLLYVFSVMIFVEEYEHSIDMWDWYRLPNDDYEFDFKYDYDKFLDVVEK